MTEHNALDNFFNYLESIYDIKTFRADYTLLAYLATLKCLQKVEFKYDNGVMSFNHTTGSLRLLNLSPLLANLVDQWLKILLEASSSNDIADLPKTDESVSSLPTTKLH